MKRIHNIKFDVNYNEDRTSIDFDGTLSEESIFFIYEVCGNLINSLYWKNVDLKDSLLNEQQIHDLGVTSSTLRALSNISGDLLKGFEQNMDSIDKILNKDNKSNEDEV